VFVTAIMGFDEEHPACQNERMGLRSPVSSL
jgi:hypothetical protein